MAELGEPTPRSLVCDLLLGALLLALSSPGLDFSQAELGTLSCWCCVVVLNWITYKLSFPPIFSEMSGSHRRLIA